MILEVVLASTFDLEEVENHILSMISMTSGNTNLALAVFSCLWESLIVFAKDWLHVWA